MIKHPTRRGFYEVATELMFDAVMHPEFNAGTYSPVDRAEVDRMAWDPSRRYTLAEYARALGSLAGGARDAEVSRDGRSRLAAGGEGYLLRRTVRSVVRRGHGWHQQWETRRRASLAGIAAFIVFAVALVG